MQLFQFKSDEVKTIIKHLRKNKAAGDDNIPAEAYIYGGQLVVQILTRFFNLLLKSHVAPSQWNNSLVTLIYKNRCEKLSTDCFNHCCKENI